MLSFVGTGAKMTVYIEYVLIDNFVIDYLLLKATFALTGKTARRGRLLFCAFLGALFALLYPLIIKNTIIVTVAKLLFGLLLVYFSASFDSVKSFYLHAAIFYGYTFLTGGAVMGIFSLFNLPYSSEYSIALMFVPVYFILRALSEVVRYVYKKKDVVSLVREVELTANGVTVKGRGFYDTGNGLYDGDAPVIVCGKAFAKKFLDGGMKNLTLKKISVKTVAGVSEKIAFRLKEIKIYNEDESHIYTNVTLCVTSEGFEDGYDVILHPALMGRVENESERIEKTKKVS